MSFVIADRVRETTLTTGTGTVTLAGAYTGFQTFSAGIGSGNSTYYAIANVAAGQWEVGIGTYTSGANTLSRTTVLASSNAGSLVNFTNTPNDVFVTQPAERALYVSSGGTGLTSGVAAFTANGVAYASSTTGLATGSGVTYDGTTFGTTADASIHGLTVGKGAGSVSTNTAFGSSALLVNTTGAYNSAFGANTLYSNTTGVSVVALGYLAGSSNTTGSYATYIGRNAGAAVTTSNSNTFVGYYAGANATGSNNTFVGCGANSGSGGLVTTGSANTILGNYSGNQGGLDIRTLSNYIVLSDGDGNPRQIVDNTGVAYFDTITSTATAGGTVILGPTATTGPKVVTGHATGTASGNQYAVYNYAGTTIGSVSQNGTTGVLFNITSDYRLKNVIGAVSGQGERIDALEPTEYEWKSDGSRTRGFLAHKFQEVYPSSVNGTKDAVDDEGKPVYQTMQASTAEVIADLVAEIQSIRARLKAANIA